MFASSPFGTKMPVEKIDRVTHFAETDSRGQRVKFGIRDSDRTRHVYVIGQTGMGKSTLLENMAVQDIQNGNGMCFIDPHGSAVDVFLDYIPEDRIEDVIYFAPFDVNNPIGFNVMEDVGPDKRHLVAQGLLAAFKKIWGEDTFSARMESMTSNALMALLEYPGSTILSLTRIFTDKNYRKKVVDNVTDPTVKAYWINEFGSWEDRYRKEATAGVLNKLGQFAANPLIRNIVGQPKASFDFREIMDKKKILLVNLSKGQVGEDNANMLGAMITTKVYLAAMSRADLSKQEIKEAPYFYLYVDEFQSVVNESFSAILSEARKYNLSLIIAHQYVEQMPETVRAAVFGNVGTKITFRVGATDAEQFEKEFGGKFLADDLVALGRFQIYLTLMIDGVGSSPFSARTNAPIPLLPISNRDKIIAHSQKTYSTPRAEVEEMITNWLLNLPPKTADKSPGEGTESKPKDTLAKKPAVERKPFKRRAPGDREGTGGKAKDTVKEVQKKSDDKKRQEKKEVKEDGQKEIPQSILDDLPGEKDFKSALADYIKQVDKQ